MKILYSNNIINPNIITANFSAIAEKIAEINFQKNIKGEIQLLVKMNVLGLLLGSAGIGYILSKVRNITIKFIFHLFCIVVSIFVLIQSSFSLKFFLFS
jgi:hypothetical protein